MIRSMTGFGTATAENEDYKVAVELKAVNQRFLELAFHMPHPLAPFEDSLRRLVRQTASRGKVDIFVTYLDKRERAASIRVDKQLAASYHAALDELSDYLHLARPDDVMQVAAYPDVLQVEKDEELEGFEPLLLEAAGKALKGFDAMRQTEGANIAQDFYRRIESLEVSVEKLKALAPAIVQDLPRAHREDPAGAPCGAGNRRDAHHPRDGALCRQGQLHGGGRAARQPFPAVPRDPRVGGQPDWPQARFPDPGDEPRDEHDCLEGELCRGRPARRRHEERDREAARAGPEHRVRAWQVRHYSMKEHSKWISA